MSDSFRFPVPRRAPGLCALGISGLLLGGPVAAPAQARPDPALPAARGSQASQVPDSLRAPLSPGRAFLYSLAVPGLAQSRLRRHSAGAIYFTVEAVSVAMLLKSLADLRVAQRFRHDGIVAGYEIDPATGAPRLDGDGDFIPADSVLGRYTEDRVKARRTHVEDWIAALAFNHLFAGADAFVSSLLWDLPARVGWRAAPEGMGIAVTLRW